MISYSVGNHLDDEKKLIFKIDEGEYKDTVLDIHGMRVDEDDEGKPVFEIDFDIVFTHELTPDRQELAKIAVSIILDIRSQTPKK